MKKMGKNGLRWLKGFHMIVVACWIGGGISLLLLYFLKGDVRDGGVLFGINQSIHHVDMLVIVIPGAFGCLVTGLIYGVFTNWGFFKHKWMIFKWIVTVTAILFGTFFLGPWETAMMEISGDLGVAALADAAYRHNEQMNFMFGVLQIAILLVTVFISIFKPWKKTKRRRNVSSVEKGTSP